MANTTQGLVRGRTIATALVVAAAFTVATPGAASATSVPSTTTVLDTGVPASALGTPGLSVAAAPTSVSGGTALWVTAAELGLRKGPSNSQPVVVTGRTDARAVATGHSRNGWLEVRMAGIKAWTPARFLTEQKPSWNPTRVEVTATNLGLRSGPLGSYPVTVTARHGTEGIFTGVSANGWWEVKVKGTFAWTPARFLEITADSAYRGDVWVDATALGLRAGPSGSEPVTVIGYDGARAYAYGEERHGWSRVNIGGLNAWTPTRFLTTSKPPWDPTRVAVSVQALDMRSGPGGGDPVTSTVPRNTPGIFTGVERNGRWEVKVNGRYDWAPSDAFTVGGVFDPDEILNVGHSQVGYREPDWRDNRYNDWINGNNAWCSVFVSWVFNRAGYEAGVPREKHFDDYVAALRRAGVLDTSVTAGELRKGDVVLVDWAPRNGPTHTGIVERVSGNSVWLVEGNTTDGSGNPGRGVFYRERSIADMHASFRPSEYARATM